MHHMTITGRAGSLQWGYYAAATLGSWSLTVAPDGGTLEAKVLSADTFRVSQRPLTFVVFRPQGRSWRWPITTLQITGETLTATLGPQEESNGQIRQAADRTPHAHTG